MALVSTNSLTSLLFITSSVLLLLGFFHGTKAQITPPVVNGLSWTFYDSSCPKLESIVRKRLQKVFKDDVGQAAGLLRLHFHDCFVQVIKQETALKPVWCKLWLLILAWFMRHEISITICQKVTSPSFGRLYSPFTNLGESPLANVKPNLSLMLYVKFVNKERKNYNSDQMHFD